MEFLFREKLIIEGISPEHALSRIAKSGITVFNAKKIKKNQILLTVYKKDIEKVFAIYPNMCYNSTIRSPFFIKRIGIQGIKRFSLFIQRRLGLIVGVLLFFIITSFSSQLVLQIVLKGEQGYSYEVLQTLSSFGIEEGRYYKGGKEKEICQKLMKIDGVSYASIKKEGGILIVDIRTSDFLKKNIREGPMKAKCSGTLVSVSILRGTLVKKIGEKIEKGETIVDNYILIGEGEKKQTYIIAIVTILCEYEEEIAVDNEDEAIAWGILKADGKIFSCRAEKTENGYRIKVLFKCIESMNF